MKQTNITRRNLAKSLMATGAAAAFPSKLNALEERAQTGFDASGGWQEVFPGVWRANIGTQERYTPVSSRLVPPQSQSFQYLPRVDKAPLLPPRGYVSARGCLIQLPLRSKELIYGLGLQLLSFGQRGKKKVTRVNADPKFDTGDSHAPVPFYITSEGIGILVDTARYATFYFGNLHAKPQHPIAAAANVNPDPNYTDNLGDSEEGHVTVEIDGTSGVDIYLFAGPTMLDVVRRYNVFSGGGVIPPEWGLGFWYRTDARATDEGVLALAKEFRERNVPCDVIGLEPGWQTHAYSCTFAWDPNRYPDPAGFLRKAKDLHFEVNLWEHAFTHPASPLFSEIQGAAGDYGVWGGLVPDFAGEQARNAFGVYHGKTLIDAGVSGFKLDECDNSDYTGGWSFPELSRFPSGVDGEQMHSVFGLRYQMTLWQEFRKRNQLTYGLVRSSGALSTPYPFVLYSDLYNHRQFVRALVNSGFSGLLWCPEVRDATSQDDLIRRLQSVIFSPLAMVNGWYIKSPPWRQLNRKLNNAGEAMEDWEALESRCREIIGWRMSLVPYLTAAFQRYALDGTPPFRALVLDTPSDAALATIDDQYMVGDRLMVAPLFADEPTRKVVVPAGTDWHDFWTGELAEGGTTVTVSASTLNIPVYVKAGSIVPWADVGLHAGTEESRRLTARIYGDGSLSFDLPGDTAAKLHWKSGTGSMIGPSKYKVHTWSHIG